MREREILGEMCSSNDDEGDARVQNILVKAILETIEEQLQVQREKLRIGLREARKWCRGAGADGGVRDKKTVMALRIQEFVRDRWRESAAKKLQKFLRCRIRIMMEKRSSLQSVRRKMASRMIQSWWSAAKKLKLSYCKHFPGRQKFSRWDDSSCLRLLMVQSAARRWSARRVVSELRHRRYMRFRHIRRVAWHRRRGATPQGRLRIDCLHRELLSWNMHVSAELLRVDRERAAECKHMARTWRHWDAHVSKLILSKPLPKHMVLYGTGEIHPVNEENNLQKIAGTPRIPPSDEMKVDQFLDLRDGSITSTHPRAKELSSVREAQMKQMKQVLEERLARLQQYSADLQSSLTWHQRCVCKKLQLSL